MKTMNEKRLSSWMSACMLVLLASVCLFSCDQKNACAEVSRSQADDYPLLESVEIPIDTVLFRYATYFRVQGDKVVIFDLHNTDYFWHTFTYPDFECIPTSLRQFRQLHLERVCSAIITMLKEDVHLHILF